MMFGCEETRRYSDAWVDGELDLSAALLVETHVGSCAGCRAEVDMIRSLKRAFGAMRETEHAPTSLRSRISAALDAEDSGQKNAVLTARKRKHATGFMLAGAALAGLVVASGRGATMSPPDVQVAGAGLVPPVLEDIATRHARDLPLEVSSNQPDQVENFFRGRLDIPVRPVTFHGVSARLVGARISNVRDRMAAALFYDMGGRRVTVFVFDSALLPRQGGGVLYRTVVNNQPIYVGNSHGYTIAFEEYDGVGYAVACDLPPQDAIRIVSNAQVQ